MNAGRLLRTVRYLKPVQIYGRLLRGLPDRAPPPLDPPAPAQSQWPRWAAPALRLPALRDDGWFDVLGEAHDIDAIGWDDPAIAKLWRYNLHYFDDLVSDGWEHHRLEHRRLIERWIAENPSATGTGWEPYPSSRRIVNWIKWLCAGNVAADGMLASLALQTQWLTRRLEYHLLGNHLFTNAKALIFAGLFFAGETADRWLASGAAILEQQLPEQMLPDGGHFELSTMYHSLALEDLLDLVNILGAAERAEGRESVALASHCRERAKAALHWMLAMSHPDGEIAFFNDAAFGIAPAPERLRDYASRLGVHAPPLQSLCRLASSGYVRVSRGPATLIADLARIGPDYLPGHAHADTLSFELSLDQQRFIVNGGTSVYGTGAERERQRGTLQHNTVIVEAQNSSEVWAGFRVGRRAYPREISVRDAGSAVAISAAHDGYRWMAGNPLHKRTWLFEDRGLTVRDEIVGNAARHAVAAFRLHPALAVTVSEEGARGRAEAPSGAAMTWTVLEGRAEMVETTWHPRFGSSEAARQLRVTLTNGGALVRFAWEAV